MEAVGGINNYYGAEKPDIKGSRGNVSSSISEAAYGLFNIDKGVNGEIDEGVFQGNTGDCWLISAVYSLASTESGSEIIKNAITENEDGSYSVYFEGVDKTYTITEKELKSANKSSLLSGLGLIKSEYSTGDDDMLLIELAMEKLVDEGDIPIETIEGITGGSAYYLYQLLTDNEVSYAYGDDYDETVELLGYYSAYQDSCAATLGVETGFSGLEDDHAYALTSLDTESATLVNPWDTTKEITISTQDLLDNLGNYDVSVVNNDVEEEVSYLEEYYA